MDNDDFLKELEELTKGLETEFDNQKQENKIEISNVFYGLKNNTNDPMINNKINPFEFLMKMGNNPDFNALNSLLNQTDMKDLVDENDPVTKEMMKQLEENLKDLETKMGMLSHQNINSNQSTNNTQPLNKNNNSDIYPNEKNENKYNETNPFLESFRELNSESLEDGLKKLMKMFGQSNGSSDDSKNIEDILKELSNTNKDENDEKKSKELFSDLLQYLTSNNLFEEPMKLIKASVTEYLEKNKETLTPEIKEKYNSITSHIDLILVEIKKPKPNEELIIDVFHKLHEMNDLDTELLSQLNPDYKNFTNIFSSLD